jgi:hypothetical protein
MTDAHETRRKLRHEAMNRGFSRTAYDFHLADSNKFAEDARFFWENNALNTPQKEEANG